MEKIFFLLERIYRMTQIPVRYIDKTGDMMLFCLGYETKHDPLFCDADLRKAILRRLATNAMPVLEFEEDFLYGACLDSIGCSIMLGPICTEAVNATKMARYASKHCVPISNLVIKHRPLNALCAALAMIHFSTVGKFVTEGDIISNRCDSIDTRESTESTFQAYELQTSEEGTTRFNFAEEINFIKLIKDGDVDSIKHQIKTRIGFIDQRSIGKLAQKSFKQHEYFASLVITLTSRAAIDGGLDSSTAYLTSDLYFQRLENTKEIPDIYRLIQDVMLDYAERVRQNQKAHSQLSYIEKCKNYISKHLNKPFTVEDIAAEVGLNKSYLSRRFSEAEGLGIQQYTQRKRIEAAANMLKFSNETILSISSYLCFASQSHFGQVFKEQMSVTPQKYRDKNRLLDFQ